jgi:hypothetical protein
LEQLLQKRLNEVRVPQKGLPDWNKMVSSRLQLIWGSTMYHIDDLPFSTRDLPDVYTQFRKVRRKCMLHLSLVDFYALLNTRISSNRPKNIEVFSFEVSR